MSAMKYRVPEDIRRAAVFDPTCVVLGASVIDFGAFGFGNTVIVDPVPLKVTTLTVRRKARAFANAINANVATEAIDEGRAEGNERVAIVFTRKAMVATTVNQGEWLGAVTPRS